MGCGPHQKDLGLLADEVKQTEGGTSRPSAPFLPTDGRHLGHIEQTGEHRLANVELLAQRCDVLRSDGLDRGGAERRGPGWSVISPYVISNQ